MHGFRLGPKASAAGFRLVAFDTVGSTNDEAVAAAKAGDPGDVWFTALQQTTGRGRRGRRWESPHGNLAASLLIYPQADPALIATLGFVAGVTLNGALGELLPHAKVKTGIDGADGNVGDIPARIALKWPNDVLADGAKLAGIMLEARNNSDGRPAIIIGFGINVVAAPQGLPYPTASISGLGMQIDAQTLHATLAEHWVATYALWNNGAGVGDVLERWRESAAGIGTAVAVDMQGQIVRGIFETIDDAGRLIVRTKQGQLVPIAAGDVHFGTTASVR